jgi:hypothetical protein
VCRHLGQAGPVPDLGRRHDDIASGVEVRAQSIKGRSSGLLKPRQVDIHHEGARPHRWGTLRRDADGVRLATGFGRLAAEALPAEVVPENVEEFRRRLDTAAQL